MTIDELPEGLKEGDAIDVALNKRLAMTLMPGKYLFRFVEVVNNIVVLMDSITENKWEPYLSELDSIQILEPKKQKCVWKRSAWGNTIQSPHGRPDTMKRSIKFCPVCGGPVEVKE